MKATVSSDITSRVIIFKIEEADAPMAHRPYGWDESKERHFLPDQVVIKIQDKQRLSVQVTGPQVLKGGKLSELTRLKAYWNHREMDRRHTAAPPEWVMKLWDEAAG